MVREERATVREERARPDREALVASLSQSMHNERERAVRQATEGRLDGARREPAVHIACQDVAVGGTVGRYQCGGGDGCRGGAAKPWVQHTICCREKCPQIVKQAALSSRDFAKLRGCWCCPAVKLRFRFRTRPSCFCATSTAFEGPFFRAVRQEHWALSEHLHVGSKGQLPSIHELVMLALELDESGYSEEKAGPKEKVAQSVMDYFSIEIDVERGMVRSIP